MKKRILILDGGGASRVKKKAENLNVDKHLIEQSDVLTKGMISVGKTAKLLIDYQLFNAHLAGFHEVLIILHPDDSFTQEYYTEKMRRNETWGIDIQFSRQYIFNGGDKPAGTADAVLQAFQQNESWQKGKVIILNSDNLYSSRALELLWNAPSNNALIGYDRNALEFPAEHVSAFSVIRSDKNGYLHEIISKPSKEIISKIYNEYGRVEVSMDAFVVLAEQLIPYLVQTPFHSERNEKDLPKAMLNG